MVFGNREYIGRQDSDRAQRRPTIGVVTNVRAHDDPNDQSNHEVNVRLVNRDEEFRRVPVHTGRVGEVVVPEQGDLVEVSFLNSRTQRPYVASFAYSGDNRAPLARSGHWRQRFGDSAPYLFVEAENQDHSAGPPDTVRLAKKQDGLSDPTTAIEIDDSGTTTQVSIETDGDITISAGGDVVIDEGGSTKSVLTEDAVFEYEQRVDTDDGTGGTTTKTTTTVSNNETTSTEIE